jgi:hypothetical protein
MASAMTRKVLYSIPKTEFENYFGAERHNLGFDDMAVHSHALAASALHTPLICRLALTPVSLSTGFSLIALVPLSMTPRSLPAGPARC